jgi:hypothetical protein
VTVTRPLDNQSMVASALANTIGCWAGRSMMHEFTRICSVAPAQYAIMGMALK